MGASQFVRRFLRQARYLDEGPDLDCAFARAGNAGSDAERLIQVLGFNQVVASKLLAGFGKRTIGDEALPIAYPYAGRGGRGVQGRGRKVVSARNQISCELRGFPVAFFPRLLA